MQHHPAAPTAEHGTSRDHPAHPLRILGLAAVCAGVAALAAAAFVLSYSGIRAAAMAAGISAHHADDYPLLIDAMLVIALLAVLGLRGAGWPSRILAWLTLLAVLAAAAGADVEYQTAHRLRYNVAATTAAVLPWALVFVAFVLLLALLRHGRLRRQASAARRQPTLSTDTPPAGADQQTTRRQAPPLPVRTPQPRNSASIVPGFSSQLVTSAAAGAAAGAAATAPGQPSPAADVDIPGHDQDPDDADRRPAAAPDDADREPAAAPDDADREPAAAPDATAGAAEADEPDRVGAQLADTGERPVDAGEPPADADAAGHGDGAAVSAMAAEPDAAPAADYVSPADDDMPVFHRMWSTPTPPDSQPTA